MLGVWMDERKKLELKNAARRHGMNMADAVRDALDLWLEQASHGRVGRRRAAGAN